ncbi:hypothetical protein ACFOOM_07550 [Streptomyces echinoruber]|uniref:CBM-cenC domain-containing protein n=1 Tax=Streptomyces echinoruber TaxID=68898 RepID=A0A918QYY4_9ACTN|nr:hypothetical protein [Streptomyces echinoruber]GGZ80233.1 hypothetical protein GCM10010389_17480 [Streptomyces echinoruber]
MPFPQTPLDVQVELQLGGAWTDITSDVYTAERITIERGRADEGQRVDPGKCALTLNNRLGKYSPRNPMSPYYGLIGRNTPIRVSVKAGSQFLRLPGGTGDAASTPHVAALAITGDIDVRVDALLVNWLDAADGLRTTQIIGKLGSATADKAWFLGVRNNRLYFEWSPDGSSALGASSTVELVVPPSGRLAVRATLDVDNGAGGRTITFYTCTTGGTAGPWTQLGAPVVQAGTTSIFNATNASLRIGQATGTAMTNAAGRCMSAEVRNGIGGTAVANPVFTAQPIGTTSFADAAGRTWTLDGGAQITNRRTRFVGEVSSWPSRWDVSGKDVRVPIEAAGILRRYGQGNKALDSTLRRRIPSGGPLAYWPMEDGAAATQFYSPIAGVQPLKQQGFDFASDDSLAGSRALPAVKGGATLSGNVPAPAGSATGWHTEFIYFLSAGPATARTVLQWYGTGTVKRWQLQLKTNEADIFGYDGDNNVVTSSLLNMTGQGIFGAWTRWQLYAVQNGSNVDWTVRFIPIGGAGAGATTTFAGSVGRISGLAGPNGYSSDLDGLKLGHIAVFTTPNTVIYNNADLAFAGETAGTRIRRLAAEEGKPVMVFGDVTDEELVGPQAAKEFLDLVEEAADVDGGILYERRDILGLAYRDRVSLFNQTPALRLDYNAPGHVAPPLEPVDDDQDVRNDITVTRDGGSSARAVLDTGPLSVQAPPNGVGVYDESVTLNLYNDDQPAQHAGWRLHLGTVDEERYPSVSVDLAAAPSLIDDVTQLDCGDRITIANPPSWLPPGPIDLLAQGYQEVIGHPVDWDLTFNCTPASAWDVAWLGNATTARDQREFQWVDTDGSQLATALTAADTVAPVLTTTGAVWAGTVADTPWDWQVAGEVMTVTAPGTLVNANPFFDTDASGWSAAAATLARSTAVVMPHPRAKASLLITPDGVTASGGAAATMTAAGTITPGAAYVASMWVYSPGGHADLRPCIDWYDAAGTLLSSSLGTGSAVAAGVWSYLEQTLTAPAGASRAVVRARHGGTPPASAVYYVWAVRITRTKSSWLYDTFNRAVTGSWGTSDSGLAWNTVGGGAASDYTVNTGYAAHVLSTVDTSRRTAVTAIHPDADIYCDLTTSALATGDSLYGAVTARMLDSGNMYLARVEFTTSNTVILTVRKIVADAQTVLGTYTLPNVTHAAGQWIRVRFQLQGTALRAKAWLASTIEPGPWAIDTTDAAITAANQIGTRSIRITGNTNAATVEVRYRAFDVINPQRYTVTRSANGISKAQAAGTDVRLDKPAIVAL